VCVFTVYCCGLSELMCYICRVSRARVSRFKGPEVVVFSGYFHPICQPPPTKPTTPSATVFYTRATRHY